MGDGHSWRNKSSLSKSVNVWTSHSKTKWSFHTETRKHGEKGRPAKPIAQKFYSCFIIAVHLRMNTQNANRGQHAVRLTEINKYATSCLHWDIRYLRVMSASYPTHSPKLWFILLKTFGFRLCSSARSINQSLQAFWSCQLKTDKFCIFLCSWHTCQRYPHTLQYFQVLIYTY